MDENDSVNEALCQRIHAAFVGVMLGKGTGLWEAQGLDDYEDEATCARYREGDEKDDWSRISIETLNRCYSSLSFFDAEGMCFHLPAFLIADLHGLFDFDLPLRLARLKSHKEIQLSLLSEEQRKIVRHYLLDISNQGYHSSHFLEQIERNWPEEIVPKKLVVNEALCQQIRDAFAGVTLGNGVGLNQTIAMDSWYDAETCARYRDEDEKDDWSRIPVEKLYGFSLSFFDAEGMRFHLPAYLLAQVQGLDMHDLGFFAHSGPHQRQQFALLTPEQRRVVRAFLIHCLETDEDEEYIKERPYLLKALEEFWIAVPI